MSTGWPVGPRWRLSTNFLLRVGGLPLNALDGLPADATAEWAARALGAEAALRRDQEATAGVLERAIAGEADVTLRRRLIALRRDVHNLRPPADRAVLPGLLNRCGPAAAAIDAWLSAWRRYEHALSEGTGIVAADQSRQQAAVARLADEPNLRMGILLASPALDDALTQRPPAGADDGKRARRARRSVLDYAQRAAAKTSPFSTFTIVGLGRFTAADDQGCLVNVDVDANLRCAASLNIAALSGLSVLILGNEALHDDLPLRLTNGWRLDDGQVRYLRRRRVRSTGHIDVAAAVDELHEELFHIPAGPMLSEVLAALTDAGQLTVTALADRLVAADPARPAADVRRYVERLLSVGLLVVPSLAIDLHDPDPVRRYADGLRCARIHAVADRVDRIAGACERYGTSPLAERRRLRTEIQTELTAAYAELGGPTPDAAVAAPPRTLLYEDAVLVSDRITASLPRWSARLLPALAEMADALPAFDSRLRSRVLTKGFFRSRYGAGGRCDDFQGFVHEFHRDFLQRYRRAPQRHNWFDSPQLDELDHARAQVTATIEAAIGDSPPGTAEIALPDDFFTGVAAMLPATGDEPASWAIAGQLTTDGSRFVLNRIYPGMTAMFSRFAHHLGDSRLTDELRETVAAAQPPGAVFAEMLGGHDATNLNLHPALTGYELVCPGETSYRPVHEQIPLHDLYIVDDPDADRLRLRSRRLNLDVIPVYLGYLITQVLPEAQQMLLNLSPFGSARMDLWSKVKPLGPVLPRLRYADVVLARSSWIVATETLPATRPWTAEAALAWARWRRDHGLPRRVFAAPAYTADPQPWNYHKPRYVDLASPLSLDLLRDLTETGQPISFTEMQPGPPDLWLNLTGAPHVSELIIELTRGGTPR